HSKALCNDARRGTIRRTAGCIKHARAPRAVLALALLGQYRCAMQGELLPLPLRLAGYLSCGDDCRRAQPGKHTKELARRNEETVGLFRKKRATHRLCLSLQHETQP